MKAAFVSQPHKQRLSKRGVVFDRYNITSEEDLREAAHRLGNYIQQKKGTLSGTLDEITTLSDLRDNA